MDLEAIFNFSTIAPFISTNSKEEILTSRRLLTACHTMKLWNIGITGNLWNWFNSYLNNQTQCVSVGNRVSNTLPVLSGVSQGSILGPIHFKIFLNNLPYLLSSHLNYLNLLTIQSFSDRSSLQWISSYFISSVNNLLSYTLSKFIFLSFHCKFNSTYTVNGHTLNKSSRTWGLFSPMH